MEIYVYIALQVSPKKLLYVKGRKIEMSSFKISIKKIKTFMFTVLGTNLYMGQNYN